MFIIIIWTNEPQHILLVYYPIVLCSKLQIILVTLTTTATVYTQRSVTHVFVAFWTYFIAVNVYFFL